MSNLPTNEIRDTLLDLLPPYEAHPEQPAQPEPDILTLLSDYETIAGMMDVIKLNHQEARSSVIPAEVKADLDNIDAEFNDKLEAGAKRLEELKKRLQEAGKAVGQTVNGRYYQVIYKKGSWGIKNIEGLLMLAIKNPAIMDCLETPKPSAAVQLRRGGVK